MAHPAISISDKESQLFPFFLRHYKSKQEVLVDFDFQNR
jgi:hypothetical protein